MHGNITENISQAIFNLLLQPTVLRWSSCEGTHTSDTGWSTSHVPTWYHGKMIIITIDAWGHMTYIFSAVLTLYSWLVRGQITFPSVDVIISKPYTRKNKEARWKKVQWCLSLFQHTTINEFRNYGRSLRSIVFLLLIFFKLWPTL